MTKSKLILILLSLAACNAIQDKTNNEGFSENDTAQWIEDGRELPASDSLFYLDNPAPLFRKEFNAKEVISSPEV